MNTRSNLRPITSREEWRITTDDVERYLKEKKINALPDDLKGTSIIVKTMNVGKYFLPFMVLLSMNAIEGNGNRSNNNELDIFNPDNSDGNKVNLKNAIYKALVPYVYNKQDEQAFFSSDWRRTRGVTSSMSSKLKYNRTPHVQVFNKNTRNEMKLVTLMIDPLRVFHDMVTDMSNPHEQFRINISSIEKIKECEYSYTFTKDPIFGKNKKDKNIDDIIALELTKQMRN